MKQYEYIENKWTRKSTRKNSKWNQEQTKAKIVDKEKIERTKKAFENVHSEYEKYTEEYKGIKANGIKYVVNNGLVKREIIIIEKQ